MTNSTIMQRREPVIWFEGTLMREPRSVGEGLTWLLETLPAVKGPTGKITIRARGGDHTANIRRNARKGTRLIIKGVAGDEGSGIDIDAISLAFGPSHDDRDRPTVEETTGR